MLINWRFMCIDLVNVGSGGYSPNLWRIDDT